MVYIMVIFVLIAIFAPHFAYAEELEAIKLSAPRFDRGMLLMDALKERKSTRSFSGKEIPVDVLSDLLWAAWGINRPEEGKRTAPSAMNLQEIDIYLAMRDGVYLYRPGQNLLEPVLARDIRESTGVQEFTQKAPVNLIYVADLSRMPTDKSGKSFFSAIDTGYISQNVYLFCASEGLATVAIAWVDKESLEELMGLRKDQKVILTQPVGYPE
ncbi:MAG: SagB/ThcOx family dehydrogenase [Candidatus Omnitrophica bacterium]|nr:SagB/ThcOx family dehydrogenase [Candidatus Omnitrophota bacterium]